MHRAQVTLVRRSCSNHPTRRSEPPRMPLCRALYTFEHWQAGSAHVTSQHLPRPKGAERPSWFARRSIAERIQLSLRNPTNQHPRRTVRQRPFPHNLEATAARSTSTLSTKRQRASCLDVARFWRLGVKDPHKLRHQNPFTSSPARPQLGADDHHAVQTTTRALEVARARRSAISTSRDHQTVHPGEQSPSRTREA